MAVAPGTIFPFCVVFVCRNQMGHMAKHALADGRASFVGVSLEEQSLFPRAADWSCVSVFIE